MDMRTQEHEDAVTILGQNLKVFFGGVRLPELLILLIIPLTRGYVHLDDEFPLISPSQLSLDPLKLVPLSLVVLLVSEVAQDCVDGEHGEGV